MDGNQLAQPGVPAGNGLFPTQHFFQGLAPQFAPFFTGQSFLPQSFAQQSFVPQLTPQGFFGNLLGSIGQPFGSAIGSIFGQPALGQQIGNFAGQLGRFLPFSVDPITAAYAQQAQLAPQGFFGNLLGSIGQPFGSAIGSIFGQPALGQQIGNFAGQLGRFLPFQATPYSQPPFQNAPYPQLPFQGTPFQQFPFQQSPFQTPFPQLPFQSFPFQGLPFQSSPFQAFPSTHAGPGSVLH
jgi:hypothetical protein